jgi:uncharacterized membrane protein YhaH (DUF805 family)
MDSLDTSALGCGGTIIMILGIVVGLAVFVFFMYCYWKICAKAGYSGAMSLLNLVPFVGSIILVCILAFGKWPAIQDRPTP